MASKADRRPEARVDLDKGGPVVIYRDVEKQGSQTVDLNYTYFGENKTSKTRPVDFKGCSNKCRVNSSRSRTLVLGYRCDIDFTDGPNFFTVTA